jgi:hypothetical protein
MMRDEFIKKLIKGDILCQNTIIPKEPKIYSILYQVLLFELAGLRLNYLLIAPDVFI